jgi:hypothetical protein
MKRGDMEDMCATNVCLCQNGESGLEGGICTGKKRAYNSDFTWFLVKKTHDFIPETIHFLMQTFCPLKHILYVLCFSRKKIKIRRGFLDENEKFQKRQCCFFFLTENKVKRQL